jgi:hypothetical protein
MNQEDPSASYQKEVMSRCITRTEIRHSNFLAWLMSPKESHNLGAIFLKWLLREIFSSDIITWANEFDVDSYHLQDIQIFREWRDVDILIVHNEFVVAVENKVLSSEHSNQLKKYRNIISESYPDKSKAFVFLTVEGYQPSDDADADSYVTISYREIRAILEILLSVYVTSLSPKIQGYIQDYLLVMNRYIMKEHESVEIAKMLYRNHKEAIDFVVENIPDRLSEIRTPIEETVQELGFILETCNKYYARFLTKLLSESLPRTGDGWKGMESFVFELEYFEKHISLKFAISPGNDQHRNLLAEIIQAIPGSVKSRGSRYLIYYRDKKRTNFMSDKYDDPSEVKDVVKSLLEKNKDKILLAEKLIIERRSEFQGTGY